ncbi:MAG: Ribosomal RNA small subunit methyltransferase G [Deltaproteobacteria bacterium]|jgi:16S rRNA (guanine527-N7)-methyltransferase|nr:Ribosomal RNA small subunit methyltransferase G [Deltaproteobacteria bacterium]
MSENPGSLKPHEVRQICMDNGFQIIEPQWQLLEKWAHLLLEHNQQINLISRKETDLLWEKQILHCLTLPILRKIPEGAEVCDFGTGGGLPGIILAIVRPDLNLTLLDSRRKKIAAVQQMIESLKLTNARTVCGRGEELGGHPEWDQRFPVITARAVAPLNEFVRWTSRLRKTDSVLHIFKGGEIKEEMSALSSTISGVKINKSLIVLKGYAKLAQNQKYLITIKVSSAAKYADTN